MIRTITVETETHAPMAKAMRRPNGAPSPFDVGLGSYPMQPWTNKNANLSQWFNYKLNPSTWSTYALDQVKKYEAFQAAAATAATATAATAAHMPKN
jgi:hypothetical protein